MSVNLPCGEIAIVQRRACISPSSGVGLGWAWPGSRSQSEAGKCGQHLNCEKSVIENAEKGVIFLLEVEWNGMECICFS